MIRSTLSTMTFLVIASSFAEEGFHQHKSPGYTDTPKISGSEFAVHQPDRPQPPRVIPADFDRSTPPPSDAVILFNGSSLDKFQPTEWKVIDGVVRAGEGGLSTRDAFGDCQLHVEWRTPNPPQGGPMSMGNSGVFLMGKYELQIFDSYSCEIYADGSAASIYGQTPPLFNVCRKPGEWQTYDIYFTAPLFKNGQLEKPATITVLHNGVFVQVNTEIKGPTRHKQALPYEPHPPRLPFYFQGHGNPVEYRNIWIRDLAE